MKHLFSAFVLLLTCLPTLAFITGNPSETNVVIHQKTGDHNYIRSDQPTVTLNNDGFYLTIDGHGETASYDVVIYDNYYYDIVVDTTVPGTYSVVNLPSTMPTGTYIIDCTTTGGITFTGTFYFVNPGDD